MSDKVGASYIFPNWMEMNEETRRNNLNKVLASPMFLGREKNIGIFDYEIQDEKTYILDTNKKGEEIVESKKGTYRITGEKYSTSIILKWNIPIRMALTFELLEQHLEGLPVYANKEVGTSLQWTNLVNNSTKYIYRCKYCRCMNVLTLGHLVSLAWQEDSYLNNERCAKCCHENSYHDFIAELALYGLHMETSEEEFYSYKTLHGSMIDASFTVSYNNCSCVLEEGEENEENRCKIKYSSMSSLKESLLASRTNQRNPITGEYFCKEYMDNYRYTSNDIGRIGERDIFNNIKDFFKKLGLNVVIMYSGEGGEADLLFSIPTEDDEGKNIYDLLYIRIQIKAILWYFRFRTYKIYSDDVIMMFLKYQHEGLGSDAIKLECVSMNTYQKMKKLMDGIKVIRYDILNGTFDVPIDLIGATLYSLYIQSKALPYWEARSPRTSYINGISEHECHMQSVKMQSSSYVIHPSENYTKVDESINILVKYWKGFNFNSKLYHVVKRKVIKFGVRYVWIRIDIQSKSWKTKIGMRKIIEGLPQIYEDDDGIHVFHLYERTQNGRGGNLYLIPWNSMCLFINSVQPDYSEIIFNDVAELILSNDPRHDLSKVFDRYKYDWNEAIPTRILSQLTNIDEKHFGIIDINDVQPVKFTPKADFPPAISASFISYREKLAAEETIAALAFTF